MCRECRLRNTTLRALPWRGPLERDRHAARCLQAIEQCLAHGGHVLRIRWHVDEIVLLVRIRREVVQLLPVPYTVVVDVLEAWATQGERRGLVRERELPVVLVQQRGLSR